MIPSRSASRLVAAYSDSWFELTYRTFSGVLGALPKRAPPVFVDYGPIPLVPETSAEAPPWRGQVAGALVYGSTTGDPDAFAEWLRRGAVPTVLMVSDLIDSGIPTVCGDYRELGRLAAQHLAVECGCRSFVHLGRSGRMSTGRREEGFRDALADLGHSMHDCRVEASSIAEDTAIKPIDDPRLDALLRRLPRPIGLFAMSDRLAAAAALTCQRLRLRLPVDVAVLGVNNTVLAHTHSPSLSSIRIDEPAIGAAAYRLLAGLMRGAEPPRQAILVGGCTLYARTSTVGPRERRTVLTVDVALERIQAAACTGLTVDRLAEMLGVSRRTLELLFRRERNTSPNEEIQRVRFETAALLLRSTTLTVTEIAARTGFSFRPPFCRFFQRMIGMSPREYRAAREPIMPRRP